LYPSFSATYETAFDLSVLSFNISCVIPGISCPIPGINGSSDFLIETAIEEGVENGHLLATIFVLVSKSSTVRNH
jgi:hypothetical protein